jgi:ATP-dependent DNA helicase RecQ
MRRSRRWRRSTGPASASATGHLVDVLMGNENEKTRRFGHVDMAGVRRRAAICPPGPGNRSTGSLLAAGLVSRSITKAFGALRLEPGARAVFKRERDSQASARTVPTKGKAARNGEFVTSAARSQVDVLEDAADLELFEALRAARTAIAKALCGAALCGLSGHDACGLCDPAAARP